MRYEVRIYNLEEMLPENRMTYIPCCSYEEAKEKYVDAIATYNDANHEVSLCKVTYLPWGESCRTIASTHNEDPYHVILEEEWLKKGKKENELCQRRENTSESNALATQADMS